MTRWIVLSAFVIAATTGACRDSRNRSNTQPPPPSAMPIESTGSAGDTTGDPSGTTHPSGATHPSDAPNPAGTTNPGDTTKPAGATSPSGTTPPDTSRPTSGADPTGGGMPGRPPRTRTTRDNPGTMSNDAGIDDTGSGSNRDFGR